MIMKTYDSQDDGDDNVSEYNHCKYDHDNHVVSNEHGENSD